MNLMLMLMLCATFGFFGGFGIGASIAYLQAKETRTFSNVLLFLASSTLVVLSLYLWILVATGYGDSK